MDTGGTHDVFPEEGKKGRKHKPEEDQDLQNKSANSRKQPEGNTGTKRVKTGGGLKEKLAHYEQLNEH